MKDLSIMDQANLVAGEENKPDCGCNCNDVSCVDSTMMMNIIGGVVSS